MSRFQFNLDEQVRFRVSGEEGKIIGRAEYSHMSNSYMVEYKDASGRARVEWWIEHSLESTAAESPGGTD